MISYLDNAATTLPCKAAAEAMERATREIYGNPSSLHAMGLEAEKAVNEARTGSRRHDKAKISRREKAGKADNFHILRHRGK